MTLAAHAVGLELILSLKSSDIRNSWHNYSRHHRFYKVCIAVLAGAMIAHAAFYRMDHGEAPANTIGVAVISGGYTWAMLYISWHFGIVAVYLFCRFHEQGDLYGGLQLLVLIGLPLIACVLVGFALAYWV